ncbi:mRNA splicing protein, partial [Coelomomyces lativittatus]
MELAYKYKFSNFSEALMIAERRAREEVRHCSVMQQKLAEKEKSLKDEQLRALAQKAREERATGMVPLHS